MTRFWSKTNEHSSILSPRRIKLIKSYYVINVSCVPRRGIEHKRSFYSNIIRRLKSARFNSRNPIDIDLWLLPLNNFAMPDSLTAVLSIKDWQLINRRGVPSARDAAIASRVLLRIALSLRTGWVCPAEAWEFGRADRGKPFVERGPDIHFSVSYAGTIVAVAVSEGYPVGVDIETLDRGICLGGMEHYLSPNEKGAIASQPSNLRDSVFLRFWTLKEAFLKSIGLGLGIELSEIDVSSVADGETSVHTVCGRRSVFFTSELNRLGLQNRGWLSLALTVPGPPSAIRLNIYHPICE